MGTLKRQLSGCLEAPGPKRQSLPGPTTPPKVKSSQVPDYIYSGSDLGLQNWEGIIYKLIQVHRESRI